MQFIKPSTRRFVIPALLILNSAAFATSVTTASLPTGTIIDSTSAPFDLSGAIIFGPSGALTPFAFTGTFDQQVLRQSDGTLAFIYQFHITNRLPQTGLDAGTVSIIDLIGFNPATNPQIFSTQGPGNLYPLDASYDIATNPQISRFNTGLSNFQQIPSSSTDSTTRPFFITTSATDYDQNGILTLVLTAGDTQSAKQFANFQPLASAPVPEPLPVLLLPLALIVLAWHRRPADVT